MIVTQAKPEILVGIRKHELAIDSVKESMQELTKNFDLRMSIPFGNAADWGKDQLSIRLVLDEIDPALFEETMAKIKLLIVEYQLNRRNLVQLNSDLSKIEKMEKAVFNVKVIR